MIRDMKKIVIYVFVVVVIGILFWFKVIVVLVCSKIWCFLFF